MQEQHYEFQITRGGRNVQRSAMVWKLFGTLEYSFGLSIWVHLMWSQEGMPLNLSLVLPFRCCPFIFCCNIIHQFSERFLGVTVTLVILSVYAVNTLLIFPNSCKVIESFEVFTSFPKYRGLFSGILPICFVLQFWRLKFTFLSLSPTLFWIFSCPWCQDTIQPSNSTNFLLANK